MGSIEKSKEKKKKEEEGEGIENKNVLIVDYNNFINWGVLFLNAPLDDTFDLKAIYFLLKNIVENLDKEFGKFRERYLFLGVSPRLPFSQRERLSNHVFSMRRLGFIPIVVEGSVFINQNEQRVKANLDGLIFAFLMRISRGMNSKDSLVLLSGDSDFSPTLAEIRRMGPNCFQLASEPVISRATGKCPYYRDILQYVDRN